MQTVASQKFFKYSNKNGTVYGRNLGQGGFGYVVESLYNGKDAIIKILHSPISKESNEELESMFEIKHQNVTRLLALVSVDQHECPQLIFPKASEGNLLQYVKEIKDDALEPLKKGKLNKFALDIINGMEYLHQMNYIHGNLAARNILIHQFGDYLNAIVSDYGMNRLLEGQGNNYFRWKKGKSLPIRWVPFECISTNKFSGVFTFSSDVWSFGVILWECWTKGDVPYGGDTSNIEVRQLLLKGHTPLTSLRPPCPLDIANVMESTFKINPEERPTFSELGAVFKEIKNKHNSAAKQSLRGTVQNDQKSVPERPSRLSENDKQDMDKTGSNRNNSTSRKNQSKSQRRQNIFLSVPNQPNSGVLHHKPNQRQSGTRGMSNANFGEPQNEAYSLLGAPPPYSPPPPPPLMDFAGAAPSSYTQSPAVSANATAEMEIQKKMMELQLKISQIELKQIEQKVQSLQENVQTEKEKANPTQQKNQTQNRNRQGRSQHRNQQKVSHLQQMHKKPENDDCSIV